MSSDKRTSKKIIYSNNIDTDMVDYNVLANMFARVPDREIPNLLRMRDERREIRSIPRYLRQRANHRAGFFKWTNQSEGIGMTQ